MAEKRVWIPKISDEKLKELASRIKPVVRFNGLPYYIIEPIHLRRIAYIWNPKLADEAKGLEELCDIKTYHAFGAMALFKPSIAEVIAAIPAEHLDNVVAFELVKIPKIPDDFNEDLEALNAGYHVATARLYIKA